MRRFSTDEIASFSEASPPTAAERCYVTSEGEIIPSIFSFFSHILCVCIRGPACQQLCAHLYFVARSAWAFRCGTGVCECVGRGVKKKDPYTGFEEPNQRLANFPCLLCSSEATAGLLFPQPPPFSAPTFSHP